MERLDLERIWSSLHVLELCLRFSDSKCHDINEEVCPIDLSKDERVKEGQQLHFGGL